jgi:putative membrane protein
MAKRVSRKNSSYNIFLFLSLCLVFLWSAIKPIDVKTWFLEVIPLILGLIVLLITYNKFRLSSLVYSLIWIDAVIILIGGHYTYPQVPVFNWIKDSLGLQRNYYDRLGHFFQGLMPAILLRELFLKKLSLRRRKTLVILVLTSCLAISACYELFEFAVAKLAGGSADQFLGTQGDTWDTQWDMLWALIGAVTALVILPRAHDRSMKRLKHSLIK